HVGSRTLPFGNRADGFAYENAAVTTSGDTLRLDATYALASANLTVTRHYAIVSGSPSFETWTTYASASAAVSELNAIHLVVPAGTIHWLTGLDGDTAGAPDPSMPDTAFTLKQQTLAIGQQLTFGAAHRASEQTVPWFAVDGAGSASSSGSRASDEFYVAL